MSSATSRRSAGPPLSGNALLCLYAIAAAAYAAVCFAAGVRLAAVIDRFSGHLPDNPVVLTVYAVRGKVKLPPSWPLPTVPLAVMLAAVVLLLWRAWWQAYDRPHLDRAAKHMAHGTQVGRLSAKQAQSTAARLGVQQPGIAIARTVRGDQLIYMGWEDVATVFAGPRSGKTVSHAIPAIMDAPGAVLVTSNKRDVVDSTRGPRSDRGRVWVFDPNAVAEEPSGKWWWNPLSYVTDEARAKELADVFAQASTKAEDRGDRFFDGAGNKLLAYLLLAAALDDRKLTQVREWLTEPGNLEPAMILEDHGYLLISKSATATITAPDKQRGGVYETAAGYCEFMENRAVMRWAQPPAGGPEVPQFDPDAFVRSTETVYSLSMDGPANGAPLVTALTVAVFDAAEALAKRSARGRLPVPLVCVLDEVANVAPIPRLDSRYSHYGSRGILPVAIMQSWSQGEQAWGKAGMLKLWGASTVRVAAAGLIDVEFLESLSRIIGDFDHFSWSENNGQAGSRSVTRQISRQRILEVSDLAAMPQGREIVIASGTRPVLARTMPWMTREYSELIKASLAEWEPAHERETREAGEREWRQRTAAQQRAWEQPERRAAR